MSRLLPTGLLSCLLSCRLRLWLRYRRRSGDLPRRWRERDRDLGCRLRLGRRGLHLFSDLTFRLGEAVRGRRSSSISLIGLGASPRDLDLDLLFRLCCRELWFFSDLPPRLGDAPRCRCSPSGSLSCFGTFFLSSLSFGCTVRSMAFGFFTFFCRCWVRDCFPRAWGVFTPPIFGGGGSRVEPVSILAEETKLYPTGS